MTQPTGAELIRFIAGLAASILLAGLGTLLVFAALPMVAPGWASTVVGSGSMAPALTAGDVVMIEKSPATSELSPPAVILVERPGTVPLLHRVVSYDPVHGLRTKGDANQSEDAAAVPEAAVIGVGRAVIPWVGLPSLWRQEGDVVAIGLALIALAVLVHLAKYGWAEQYDPWRAAAEAVAGSDPSLEDDIPRFKAHAA